MVGPPPRYFERMVCGSMIKTPNHCCQHPQCYLKNDPGIDSLHGKISQCTPDTMVSEFITISPEVLDLNSNMEITEDLIFVNKIPFLVTLVQRAKLATI